MELQVKIDGIEFVIDLINDFMKEAEFKENVKDD